jgi:hypothetical protein
MKVQPLTGEHLQSPEMFLELKNLLNVLRVDK